MRYVVYDKQTGRIIRTYRRVLAESGEAVPADESAILSDLPRGVAQDQVSILAQKELNLERGKVYRVDTDAKKIVEVPKH